MSFDTALSKTLGFEGGLSDNPLDHGGRTKWGITQATYDAWRSRQGLATRPVDELTERERDLIYREEYWDPIHGDELPERLGELVFDMAVNSGVRAAKLTLQRSLGVDADGVMGEKTIAAAQEASPLAFLKRRVAFIRDLIRNSPGQVEFLAGWVNRLLEQAWRA